VFTIAVLPLVALVLVWAAIGRYRLDARARLAGVVAALAGTLGVSLALPEMYGALPLWQLLALGAVAIVVAVAGAVYAERRLKRVRA
jgi:hypothetical protein